MPWTRSSRLLWLLAVTTLVPIAVLTWLGTRNVWRLMRMPVIGGEPVFDGLESSTAVVGKSLPAATRRSGSSPTPSWFPET